MLGERETLGSRDGTQQQQATAAPTVSPAGPAPTSGAAPGGAGNEAAQARMQLHPAGCTDPSKWGGGLDTATKSFFKDTVLNHQPYTPPAAAPAAPAAGAP